MAGTTNQVSGDVIDAIRPDLEAFASLWSALRTNYQGTNITKTVARLLHMYQPEDGVLAYERLLRTLYVLLEDFDGDGLRLLVSMVPPPKGVPDETIKEVFYKATSFVRLNAPIFHRNSNAANLENEMISSSSAKTDEGSSDSRTPVNNTAASRLQSFRNSAGNVADASTILRAVVKSEAPRKSNKSPKNPTQESEVFRGFPSNEITTTQSHARTMTHFYRPPMNYAGYPATQRYVDYHQIQGQSEFSNPPRGMETSNISPAYRLKWFETPMLMRKNNYDGNSAYPDLILKTSDNKYIRLPITKVNGPPINNYASYNPSLRPSYQTYYQNNQMHMRSNVMNENTINNDFSATLPSHSNPKNPLEENLIMSESMIRKVEASRMNLIDHDYELGKTEDKENFGAENAESPTDATIEKFRDTVKCRQRAIQEDIYRMDVVRSDQDIVSNSTEELKVSFDVENLTVTEELKNGVKNFLKRAEEGKSIELPPFPRTKAIEHPRTFPALVKSPPRMWKLERLGEYPGDWKQAPHSQQAYIQESSHPFSYETRIASMKSLSHGETGMSRGSRSRTGKNSVATKSERTENSIPSTISSDRSSSISGEGNNVGFSGHEELPTNEPEIKTNEAFHQTNSLSELVNYRKQYYDALLSIQRAKVAVANSLAISSSQTSTNYDPRVFQYLQQQHQLLHQQQQQLLMASQHPVTRSTMMQPGYSNIRNSAGLWIRPNDWKYPPCGQYAFPRQTHSMSSSSCTSQIPMNLPKDSPVVEDLRRSSRHLHRTSPRPPTVKRRKLEEIVGKLKESDN